MLASQFSGPVLRLAQLWQDLTQFRISLERLGDLLAHPTESLVGRVRGGPKLKGSVSFDNVSFRYPAANTDALNEFNLAIAPGEVVASVGRSGSGKARYQNLFRDCICRPAVECVSMGLTLRMLTRDGSGARLAW